MNLIRKVFYSFPVVRNKCVSAKMKIETKTPVIPCKEAHSHIKAAEFLANGHVIAVPTDTIYGLACSANCPKAIQKLYTIKGRDSAKPVAICVTKVSDVRKWGESNHLSDSLLHRLLPGPITVVLEKSKLLDNPFLNPSTIKIGIRIPNHEFMNSVTEMFDMPVALTSANFSNEPSTLSVKEFEHLFCHLGAVFDGGILSQLEQNRTGSTVIDLSQHGCYKIIRKGISYESIISIVESYGLTQLYDVGQRGVFMTKPFASSADLFGAKFAVQELKIPFGGPYSLGYKDFNISKYILKRR